MDQAQSIPVSNRQLKIPTNQAIAYIIGTPAMFAPLVYWQYGAALFGAYAMLKLFIIGAVGGTISFAIYAGAKRWLLGALLGLPAGIAACGVHHLYTLIFHKESMYTSESALLVIAGAGPFMFALHQILQRDSGTASVFYAFVSFHWRIGAECEKLTLRMNQIRAPAGLKSFDRQHLAV